MSKIKTITLSLGLVAALGVAALPVIAHADTQPESAATLDIDVSVDTTLSMTLESHSSAGTSTGDDQSVRTTVSPGTADTSSMYTNIYVSTNSPEGYTLTLVDSDNNANLQSASGATIAPISSEPVGDSNPGWAILIDGQSVWRAMPAANSGNLITVKSYAPSPKAVTVNDLSKVTYGVAAASNQESGIYHDEVVYTATAI